MRKGFLVLLAASMFIIGAGIARAENFFDSATATTGSVAAGGGRATLNVVCDDAQDWATGGTGYWTRNNIVEFPTSRHILSMLPIMDGKQVQGYQFNVENDNPGNSATFTGVIVCGRDPQSN